MKRNLLARLVTVAAVTTAAAVALTACSTASDLQAQFNNDNTKNYISGDGTLTEIKPADRGDTVNFSGTDDQGETVSRKQYDGKVVVLNFWYASCPPCRLEAPELESLSEAYQAKGVQFVGVNVRDQADTSRAFARSFKITYPSIVDATNAKVQLALAGSRGPNSTPTTIVLDQQGRVAARFLGGINKSNLDTVISDTLAEAQ